MPPTAATRLPDVSMAHRPPGLHHGPERGVGRRCPQYTSEVLAGPGDTRELTAGPAEAPVISRVITHDALNEVRTRRRVCDTAAPPTGSGGPVLPRDGSVGRVNLAVTHDLEGSNFGAWIHLARSRLRSPIDR